MNVNLRDSRIGRAWIAMRDDEPVAACAGIPIVRTKLMAYGTGAAFGGISGAFFASYLGVVNAGQFEFSFSIFIFAMVVLGGLGSIAGVVVGAIVLSVVNNYLLPDVLFDLPGKIGLDVRPVGDQLRHLRRDPRGGDAAPTAGARPDAQEGARSEATSCAAPLAAFSGRVARAAPRREQHPEPVARVARAVAPLAQDDGAASVSSMLRVELARHVAERLAGRGQNRDGVGSWGLSGSARRRERPAGRRASSEASASGRCTAPATWLTSRPAASSAVARHEASGGVDWVVPGHPDLAAVVRIPVALLAFDGDDHDPTW